MKYTSGDSECPSLLSTNVLLLQTSLRHVENEPQIT